MAQYRLLRLVVGCCLLFDDCCLLCVIYLLLFCLFGVVLVEVGCLLCAVVC